MQVPFVIQIYFPITFFSFLFSFFVTVFILITSLLKLWLRIPLVKTDDDDVIDANSTSFVSDVPFYFVFGFHFVRSVIFVTGLNGRICMFFIIYKNSFLTPLPI